MNKIIDRVLFIVRFSFSLMIVAVVMAVSCPQPGSEITHVDPLEPVETKSVERTSFETGSIEGFYKNGICLIAYDSETFQKAVNPLRKTYRIQSDDQKRYMNILFSEGVTKKPGDECVCTINYGTDSRGETMLVVRFVTIRVSGGYIWLWNELQKVGIIVPDFESSGL